jgi:hypothetical protein
MNALARTGTQTVSAALVEPPGGAGLDYPAQRATLVPAMINFHQRSVRPSHGAPGIFPAMPGVAGAGY